LKRDHNLSLELNENTLNLFPKAIGQEGDTFKEEVIQRVRQAFNHLDGVIKSLAVSETMLEVVWQDDRKEPGSLEKIAKLLTKGNYDDGILLLELFLSEDADDPILLYNLGMAYSDQNAMPRAVELLSRLASIEPDHINGRVALGVALLRMGKTDEGVDILESVAGQSPDNLWAHRNLGAGLMQSKRYADAVEHYRRATEIDPRDQAAWFGYGQALEASGQIQEADNAYQKANALDEFSDISERARRARSVFAEKTFHSVTAGQVNMAAVMYLLGALQKFAQMSRDQVQKIGFEIAILGTRGIDPNSPDQQYTLRSLAGKFSGLHLLCLQYAAFKHFAPEQDIGFDLSAEYQAALALFDQKS
jgi:tetratricopeptide (TPR) repeat protein